MASIRVDRLASRVWRAPFSRTRSLLSAFLGESVELLRLPEVARIFFLTRLRPIRRSRRSIDLAIRRRAYPIVLYCISNHCLIVLPSFSHCSPIPRMGGEWEGNRRSVGGRPNTDRTPVGEQSNTNRTPVGDQWEGIEGQWEGNGRKIGKMSRKGKTS